MTGGLRTMTTGKIKVTEPVVDLDGDEMTRWGIFKIGTNCMFV